MSAHAPATPALDSAIAAYRRATPASAALHARASRRLPGGVTSSVKYFAPHPIYLSSAAGSHVVDVDGREYVDYCLGFGPLIAGHGHPRILEAVRAEASRAGSLMLGGPSDLECRLAERLAGVLPSAEMVRFTSSGTEATLLALRLARGATGRTRIIKFEGHYHGGHDHVLWNVDRALPAVAATDGIPALTADQTIVLPFNDIEALRAGIDAAVDVAAVIVEPVARGVIAPDTAWLAALRTLTAQRGIVLIFDEIVVWPRAGLGGAQALYGVTPDLTTLGKALGAGLPLGALAGKKDLLRLLSPRASRDRGTDAPYVFHGGTYNGTPIALAAGLATLNILEEPDTLPALNARASELGAGLREAAMRHGVALSLASAGSIVDFYFTEEALTSSRAVWRSDLVRRRGLDYRLLCAGIYNAPVHRYHLSLSHTSQDIDRTIQAFEGALNA